MHEAEIGPGEKTESTLNRPRTRESEISTVIHISQSAEPALCNSW